MTQPAHGALLRPQLWTRDPLVIRDPVTGVDDIADYGVADFDNEHGETIASVHMVRNDDGTYRLLVDAPRSDVSVEVN